MAKNKQNKPKFVDDGHTIFNMDVDASWAKKEVKTSSYVPKDEQRLIIKAAFKAFFPKLLLVLACFGVAMLIICLWLS